MLFHLWWGQLHFGPWAWPAAPLLGAPWGPRWGETQEGWSCLGSGSCELPSSVHKRAGVPGCGSLYPKGPYTQWRSGLGKSSPRAHRQEAKPVCAPPAPKAGASVSRYEDTRPARVLGPQLHPSWQLQGSEGVWGWRWGL